MICPKESSLQDVQIISFPDENKAKDRYWHRDPTIRFPTNLENEESSGNEDENGDKLDILDKRARDAEAAGTRSPNMGPVDDIYI
eukprot:9485174-Pyramimonas_sp.AAC.1